MLAGAAARLAAVQQVFVDGRIYPGGPDGYYHLRRALLILRDWPRVPQSDPFLNAPDGGLISWPPLFDFLLATLAMPWRSSPHRALELVGASLPFLLGILQVALVAWIAHLLHGKRAAVVAAFTVALLPGAVRYTLLGALDHDPFYETCGLLTIVALARLLRAPTERESIRSALLIAISLTAGVLAWTGAIVQMAILFTAVAAALVADRTHRQIMCRAVAAGSLLAALAVARPAITSVWTRAEGATFEGLSLLHVAVLAGIAFVAGVVAWLGDRRDRLAAATMFIAGAASVVLVPLSVVPFVRGLLYATGNATILSAVAEARPLLFLWGTFDLRPALVRLTLLPLAGALIVAHRAWVNRDSRMAVPLAWFAVTFILALTHSRFTYSAALAGAVIAGIAVSLLRDAYSAARTAAAVFALTFPLIVAYVPVPGFEGFALPARPNDLRASGLEDLVPALRSRDGVVVAPWYLGHWVMWLADRPVAMSPMLTVGQSRFTDTLRIYFERDPAAFMRHLDSRGARWLIVTADVSSAAEEATVAGIPREQFVNADGIDLQAYMSTIAGRLALAGPGAITFAGSAYPALPRVVERSRSAASVATPFGPRPLLRLYEILPAR
jgi:asparagine N-glycosylation enzyme membrane subunit Stt3